MRRIEHNPNELVTISFERYSEIMMHVGILEEIRSEMSRTNNKISKSQAEELLNRCRITIGFYLGKDPYAVEIS